MINFNQMNAEDQEIFFENLENQFKKPIQIGTVTTENHKVKHLLVALSNLDVSVTVEEVAPFMQRMYNLSRSRIEEYVHFNECKYLVAEE
jgi:hypothetical protein